MNRCTEQFPAVRLSAGGLKTWLPLCAALVLAGCASHVSQPGAGEEKAPEQNAPAAAKAPDKGDAEQRFQQALQLMKGKKPQEARDAFAKLAQDFPQYAGPLNDLGVLQAQGKQRDQAIASFARAASVNAQDDFAWGWLGILYRENGDYGRSEQAYQKAIALKSGNPITHLNLGILYDAYLRRPQDALAQYREYQRIAGKDSKPIVAAWINELQDGLPQAAGKAPAAGQVTPAAGTVPAVEHKP
ncbi:MAG: tetratricopeptide repeat protein [Nevskia sp.]|nr:tetratricopeptide repeat protein [Nevskia sp.]